MNISEISEMCTVSDATVVRMAQHLGYKGYHQMRLLLSKDKGFNYQENNLNLKEPMDFFFNGEMLYLKHIFEDQNKENLNKLIKLIRKSSNTIIVGLGNAIPVTLDLEFRLNRLGFKSFASTVFETTMNYINNSYENTVLIAVSNSGLSTRVLDAIRLAKKNKMKVVSIVGDLSSPIANESNLYIYSGNMKRFIRNIQPGVESYIGEYLINDLLIMNLSYSQPKNEIDQSTNLEIELSSNKL